MTRIDPPSPPRIPANKVGDQKADVDRQHQDDFGDGASFEGEGFQDVYEELGDVSIEALIAFLQKLLLDRPPPQKQASAPTDTPTDASSPNAKAAAAYQSHYVQTSPVPIPLDTVESPSGNTTFEAARANLDQGEIQSLIRSLVRLNSQGIRSLSLEKTDSFLTSVAEAIKRATTP